MMPKAGLTFSTRLRGVTLIEAVLFISIALGLIVGGIVFFQQASLAQRVSTQTRFLSALVSETRALYQQQSNFQSVSNVSATFIEDVLVAAGAVPAPNIRRNAVPGVQSPIVDAWGNDVGVIIARVGADIQLVVTLNNVPQAACVRLVPVDARGSGVFTNGIT